MTRDYELHARGVAQSIGLHVTIERTTRQACPPWSRKPVGGPGAPCDHRHGLRYAITLQNTRGERLTFFFWDSMHHAAMGQRPTTYDVLACVASEARMPTTADAVAEELGEMRPSQAQAVADHAAKLQKFFTPRELDRLDEVQ